ncbi:ribosomal protein S9 family protein [Gracilaria domingensis]|nr:ribosomal protein S9 family protein [Gracilaria domingensis]
MFRLARRSAHRGYETALELYSRRAPGSKAHWPPRAFFHISSKAEDDSGVEGPDSAASQTSHKAQVIEFPDPNDPTQNPLAELAAEDVQTAEKYWKTVQSSQKQPTYHQKLNEYGEAHAIGRRKRSNAKIWLTDGEGRISINGRSWVEYFPRIDHRDKVLKPLDLLGKIGKMDIRCNVKGGGVNGQAEAIRHGIARALQNWDPNMRPTLKANGLLTRDSRVVESKKYGRKKARKSFQWVKR